MFISPVVKCSETSLPTEACVCVCVCRKVKQHEAETAGAIMAFFLALGLALGAALSFAFRALVWTRHTHSVGQLPAHVDHWTNAAPPTWRPAGGQKTRAPQPPPTPHCGNCRNCRNQLLFWGLYFFLCLFLRSIYLKVQLKTLQSTITQNVMRQRSNWYLFCNTFCNTQSHVVLRSFSLTMFFLSNLRNNQHLKLITASIITSLSTNHSRVACK